MSASANKTIQMAEFCLSLTRVMAQNYKTSKEIDSRDKAEDYNAVMEPLQQRLDAASREFCYERDIFEIYTRNKQIELLERIATALEKIAERI